MLKNSVTLIDNTGQVNKNLLKSFPCSINIKKICMLCWKELNYTDKSSLITSSLKVSPTIKCIIFLKL